MVLIKKRAQNRAKRNLNLIQAKEELDLQSHHQNMMILPLEQAKVLGHVSVEEIKLFWVGIPMIS